MDALLLVSPLLTYAAAACGTAILSSLLIAALAAWR